MCLATPGKIVKISEDTALRIAKVDFGGVTKSNISLFFCPEAKINDFCIVHAGVALQVINEECT